ncbi:tyrosine--tRNA ligase [Mycoplasmopsis hyopharyngis]|uniref:tyrosine--tRNA ligase n=1 Tax=Mycoplasmopsis hyopharyngis TaxID=29558 RepID=UPI003873796F
MNILEDITKRGIFKQISNLEKFNSLVPENTGVYIGFDPTAKSLHLGNYVQISILKRFQNAGFKAYALIGGATGMIGDPSFKDAERTLLDNKTVIENKNNIKKQLEKFGLTVLDNYDFYKNMNVIDFLRDVGKLLNVSYMLSKDSVANRINSGLSFTEFSYQLLQGWDFYSLYKKHNILLQLGGSDQWGNITSGLEIISKLEGDNHKAVVITSNLLLDDNGKKYGKSTGGGSLWLDKKMNSPYNMYQFLLNQPDSKIEELLKWLTFIPLDEIEKIIKKHNENPSLHYAQNILASEVIKDIHGLEELEIAQEITKILFDKNYDLKQLKPSSLKKLEPYLPTVTLEKNMNIVEQLIEAKVILSKREAREFINTNALKIDGQPLLENTNYEPKNYEGKYAFLNKGKKQIWLIKTK